VHAQGKHRYYSLKGADVANALEALSVVAGAGAVQFVPSTPSRLRSARTCYDHMAGEVAVQLHDQLHSLGWLRNASQRPDLYELSDEGRVALGRLGVDIDAADGMRRRFAYACLDWSERRPHIGGALGAALLKCALQKKWVTQDGHGRGLALTKLGRHSLELLHAAPAAGRTGTADAARR